MIDRSYDEYQGRPSDWLRLIPLVIAALVLLVYNITLQPGLSGGDSAEAQFAPYTLSIMHYTGYPLYTVLGYIWSRLLEVGSVAYRMNLLSAVAGAIVAGCIAWLGHALSRRWIGGIAAAILLACSTLFWDWSTKAGVRSINVAFVAGMLALAVAWGQTQRSSQPALNNRWVTLWLVVGLSLAHHRTTILILPGVLVYLLWVRRHLWRDWRAWLVALAALIPGLLFYVYLPWRGSQTPAYQPLPVDSLDHFLDLVLARNLSDMVTAITWSQVPQRLGWFVEYLVMQFGVAGVCIATIGLLLLLLRRPKTGVMLWSALILLTAFTIDYRIEGMARLNVVFLLPVLAIASLGMGYCLAMLAEQLERLSGTIASSLLHRFAVLVIEGAGIVAVIALTVPVAQKSLAWVYPTEEPAMDAYREELRGQQASRLTEYAEPFMVPGSVVVGEWEHVAAFWYQKLVNGRWQNAEFRYPVDDQLGPYIEQAWSEGREIYVTRAVPGLGNGRSLSMAGPLIHIQPQPSNDLPDSVTPVLVDFEDGIALAGYYVFTDTMTSDGVLPVSLYWQARRELRFDYSISVRLIDQWGRQVAQEDAAAPVLGSYPTSSWIVGAIVGDYYELRLPANLPDGMYSLSVVVYQRIIPTVTRNLRAIETGAPLVPFGKVYIGG